MRDEVLSFVQRQRAVALDKIQRLVQNDDGQMYRGRYKLEFIEEYIRDFSDSTKSARWILIPGLRGTGKTTLMAQCAHRLLLNSVNSVFFFSLDEAMETTGATLFEVLEAYESP